MVSPSELAPLLQPWIDHWKVIILGAIGWAVFERIMRIWMNAILPIEHVQTAGERDSRAVGIVFAIVISTSALLAIFEPNSPLEQDHILGSSYIASSLLKVASG